MKLNKDLNEFKIFVRLNNKFLTEHIDENTIDILGGIEYENLTMRQSVVELMKSQYNTEIHKELLIYLGTDPHDISYYYTIIISYDSIQSSLNIDELLNSNISLITRNFIENNYNRLNFYANCSIDEVIVSKVGTIIKSYNKYRIDLISCPPNSRKKFEKNRKHIIVTDAGLLGNLIPRCNKARTINFIKDKINKINKFVEI